MKKVLWSLVIILIIIDGCMREEWIYNEDNRRWEAVEEREVDREVGMEYYSELIEDVVGEYDVMEGDDEVDVGEDVEIIEDVCDLGDVILSSKDVMYEDYEYPDNGNTGNMNVCEGGSIEKRFEQEWKVKTNWYWEKTDRYPLIGYHNGRLYAIGYESVSGVSYSVVINENGEVEESPSIWRSLYSSGPVIDDNGDVYYTTGDGWLEVIRMERQGVYKGDEVERLSFVGERYSCGYTARGLVPPVIGYDRTVYALLRCFEWDNENDAGMTGRLYERIVGAKGGVILWKKDVKEIFGEDESPAFNTSLYISPDDKLMVKVYKKNCDAYKWVFINNEGEKVRETPWFEYVTDIFYNTPETYIMNGIIFSEDGRAIGSIKGERPDVGLVIEKGFTVSTAEGDIFTYGYDKKLDIPTCIYRINRYGKIIKRFDLTEKEIPEQGWVYLNNDGLMFVARNWGEVNKLVIYVMDSELNVVWKEEKELINRFSYPSTPYMLLPECGKFYIYYGKFLGDKEEGGDEFFYKFNISNGLGPGRSTWPMWKGDPRNTGRVQIYK